MRSGGLASERQMKMQRKLNETTHSLNQETERKGRNGKMRDGELRLVRQIRRSKKCLFPNCKTVSCLLGKVMRKLSVIVSVSVGIHYLVSFVVFVSVFFPP